MVGDKSNRDIKNCGNPFVRVGSNQITNIRFQPRLAWISAAAGISQCPIFSAKFLTNELRGAAKFLDIGGALCHSAWNTVRREIPFHAGLPRPPNALESFVHAFCD